MFVCMCCVLCVVCAYVPAAFCGSNEINKIKGIPGWNERIFIKSNYAVHWDAFWVFYAYFG